MPASILLKGVAWITAFDKLFLSPVVKIILSLGEAHLNSLLNQTKPNLTKPNLTCRAASAESPDTTDSPILQDHDVETRAPNLSVLLRSPTEGSPLLETTEGKLRVSGSH